MISYADDGEDVVLQRALGNRVEGVYVDVGAQSPNRSSITRHFYEAGWRGINIVPLAEWSAGFREARPGDVNLEVALDAVPGVQTLYRVREDPGLATLSRDVAAGYRRAGLHVEEWSIPVVRLSDALEKAEIEQIDFLSIRARGAEGDVLGGLDLNRWRPRVIVVAANHRPRSSAEGRSGFEPNLIAHRYVFAATDGVNRYYARAEEAETLLPLLVPANSTDTYVTYREVLLEEKISRLRVTVRELEHDLEVTRRPLSLHETPLAPSSDVAPRRPQRSGLPRVIHLERIAICTTPQTGAARLAARVTSAVGARDLITDHPADVNWAALPDRCVLVLSWPRTEQFHALLATNGFRVLTVRRHPFDTLLCLLRLAQTDRETGRILDAAGGRDDDLWHRGPNSDAFLDWATGPRAKSLLEVSTSWAADAAALKIDYDGLVRDETSEVARLLELGGYEVQPGESSARDGATRDLESLGGDWRQYVSAGAFERLAASLAPIATGLGFDVLVDPSLLPSSDDGDVAWRQLLEGHLDRSS